MNTALYLPIGAVAAACVTAFGSITAAVITARSTSKRQSAPPQQRHGYHREESESWIPYVPLPAAQPRKSKAAAIILALVTGLLVVVAIGSFAHWNARPLAKPPLATPSTSPPPLVLDITPNYDMVP